MAIKQCKALSELSARRLLRSLTKLGVKQPRAEHFVQLGTDEGQPLLQAIAGERARRRRKTALRREIGKVLNDRNAFGEQLAVIKLQDRHISLRVDGGEVLATRRTVRLGANVDAFELERDSSLTRYDVRRQ